VITLIETGAFAIPQCFPHQCLGVSEFIKIFPIKLFHCMVSALYGRIMEQCTQSKFKSLLSIGVKITKHSWLELAATKFTAVSGTLPCH